MQRYLAWICFPFFLKAMKTLIQECAYPCIVLADKDDRYCVLCNQSMDVSFCSGKCVMFSSLSVCSVSCPRLSQKMNILSINSITTRYTFDMLIVLPTITKNFPAFCFSTAHSTFRSIQDLKQSIYKQNYFPLLLPRTFPDFLIWCSMLNRRLSFSFEV